MTPSISVVVPCRNERGTLRACLDALLAQDFPRPAYEVIVVDGGSTDGSADLAQAMGARVLRDEGKGPAGARNVGIREAQGEVVAFTDADCMPRPDWLTRVAEVFAEDPGLAGVAGAIRMPRDSFLGRLEDDEARALYRGFITSNVAYARDALRAVGGFDETLTCAEDYDLAWRVMDAGYRVVHDPRPIVVHAPPEVRGSVAGYLRKQWWYARSDVVAHLRATRRARLARGPSGSLDGAAGAARAAADAAWAAGLVAGAVLRSPVLAGLAVAGAAGASLARLRRMRRAGAGEPGDDARRAALVAARRFARGLGTLAGYADLARPSRRALLRPASSRVPLWPPASPQERARAAVPSPRALA